MKTNLRFSVVFWFLTQTFFHFFSRHRKMWKSLTDKSWEKSWCLHVLMKFDIWQSSQTLSSIDLLYFFCWRLKNFTASTHFSQRRFNENSYRTCSWTFQKFFWFLMLRHFFNSIWCGERDNTRSEKRVNDDGNCIFRSCCACVESDARVNILGVSAINCINVVYCLNAEWKLSILRQRH